MNAFFIISVNVFSVSIYIRISGNVKLSNVA